MSTHSLSFDGSGDYVDFGSDFPDLDGVCSISLWVKFNVVDAHQALVWDTLSGQLAIRLNTTAKLDWFQGSGPGVFQTSGSLSTNIWYHLLFVRTGSSGDWDIRVFIDGVEDSGSPGTITDNPAGSPTSYRFGHAADLGGFSLNGFMDEVAVWASDQSAQAAGLADGSVSPSTLSPLGFWKFDEGSGATAGDDGSGGNDGDITGATYSTDVPDELAGGGGGTTYHNLLLLGVGG